MDITVDHASGDTKVKSLTGAEALVLSGGSLYSVGGYQINNAFSATGGKLVVNPANDQLVATGDINISPDSTVWFQARGGPYRFKKGTYTVLKTSGSLTGDFGPPGLYWGYGSRKYVDQTTYGVSYSSSALSLTILKDLYPCDPNMDTMGDVSDLNIWMTNRFKYDTDWYRADLNGNGNTDVSDLNILSL